MTLPAYPVAANADAALAAPLGHAARAREAGALAGGAVRFTTELVGPAFATREAAEAAYAGRLGEGARLTERLAGKAAPKPVRPVYRDGRRWPAPPAEGPATVWRLELSYWKAGDEAEAPADQARTLRRRATAAELDAERLRALRRQPLRPTRPQQPLDIGLFETRLPEAPHIVVADE
ncbi:MAG: hypothetical protein IT546_10000 [Caulobacteraceae bacterium]|nr:hypothetical protein [Caulobacteraceae bacterium]